MNEPREWARLDAQPLESALDRTFQFSSPQRTFAAASAGAALSFARREDVVGDVQRALAPRARTSPSQLVAGALAFDTARVPRLRLYEGTRSTRPERTSGIFTTPAPREVSMRPTPQAYKQAVARAVRRIELGELRKVVLSRALDLSLREPLDLDVLLWRLAQQNPGKFVFRCDVSASERAPCALLGASPELLVAKSGIEVSSHPLAGSLPRSADQAEDRARSARLVESRKNLAEHAVVVEAVGDTLAPYCRELSVPRQPSLVQTTTMWHLGTKITGRLRDPELSSLELALALHPTPAVCGVPEERAARAIRELEGFERDFFAGAVGYTDARGDGEWAVSIRCAEAREGSLRLYAGAGIVADSTPEDELAETSAKLQTMLRALGFEDLRVDA